MTTPMTHVRTSVGSSDRVSIQPVISALWVVLALAIPIYRILPGTVANLWTYGALGLVMAVLLLGRGGKPKWPGVWMFAGLCALVAGVVSSGASGLAKTLPIGIQLFILLGLTPFALRGSVLRDARLLTKASMSFTVAQSVSALVGVVQLLGVPVLGYAAVYGRSPGLAGHPNVLGVMGAIAVLLCTHMLAARVPFPHFLLIGALTVNAAGVLTTGSLSSMFACAFGVLFILSSHRIPIRKVVGILAVGALALWAVLQSPVVAQYFRSPADRFFQVTGQTDDISTLDIRLKTYHVAWERIQIDPFMGKGIDPGQSAAFGNTMVHNLFLHAWYQGGIALAAGIGAVLLAALILVVQALRTRQFALPVAVLITVLSYALTSAFFEQVYYWLPVIAAWASLPTTPITNPEKPPALRTSPRRTGRAPHGAR